MLQQLQVQSRATPSKRAPRSSITLVTILAIAFAVSGCSTPTPYGPALDGKGYSQLQTESDRFRVSFSGNSLTPRATVESYLLYRAAEITLQSGHDYFRVVAQDLESTTRYYDTVTTPPVYYGDYGRRSHRYRHGGRGFPYAYYPHGQFSTVTSHPVTSYEAVANIIVFSGKNQSRKAPTSDDHTYNARDVIKRLEPTIVRPDPHS